MADAFCFDLDGTVTSREILPMLAAEVGFYEEIKALTDATIRGIIPFASSFKLRCKILADIPIPRVREIVAGVPLFPRVVEFMRGRGPHCFIVTGNLDVWVDELVKTIGVAAYTSQADIDGDRLLGVRHVLDKGRAVLELRSQYDRIIAVGDGMGDVGMFEQADIRIAFGALHRPVDALIQTADMVCFSEQALCHTLEKLK